MNRHSERSEESHRCQREIVCFAEARFFVATLLRMTAYQNQLDQVLDPQARLFIEKALCFLLKCQVNHLLRTNLWVSRSSHLYYLVADFNGHDPVRTLWL